MLAESIMSRKKLYHFIKKFSEMKDQSHSIWNSGNSMEEPIQENIPTEGIKFRAATIAFKWQTTLK